MSGEGSGSGPLQVKKSVFEWVVPKAIFMGDDSPHLYSGTFILGLEEETSWYLYLKSHVSSSGDRWASLCLYTVSKSVGHIHTKFKLGLVTKDGKERNVKYAKCIFTDTNGHGWTEFIKLDSLLAEDGYYFTIFCDLQVYRKLEVPESTFNGDISGMLESTDFSDATLVVGGEELKVHRNVLSSRSPVFRTMFLENKRSSRFEIDDLDVNGVKGLLKFIYSGKVKNLAEIAQVVLPAAAKYGVERLKALCEQELCDNLDDVNVMRILKFAERHAAKQLKAQALAFISVNSAEVVDNPGFWKLNESNQKLFKEVVRAQAKWGQNGEPSAKRVRIG